MTSIRPLLEMLMLLGAFGIKVAIHFFATKLLDRHAAHLSAKRSFVAVALISILGSFGASHIVSAIPSALLPYAVFVVAVPLYLASVLITIVICECPLPKASLVGLIWIIPAVALNHYTPRLATLMLPEGPSLAEHFHTVDAATAAAQRRADEEKARREAEGEDEEEGPGVIQKALDPLASLTAEDEREAIGNDLARGLELYAERKRLMAEMSPEEVTLYRAEMAAFMQEQGLATNRYSMEQLESLNTNDMELIMSALTGAEELFAVGVETAVETGDATESIRAISSNLASLNFTKKELARFKQAADNKAIGDLLELVAKARARQRPPPLPPGEQVNLLAEDIRGSILRIVDPEEMARIDAEAGRAPDPVDGIVEEEGPRTLGVPIVAGELLITIDADDVGPWVDAARTFDVKGFANLSGAAVVLMANGSLLEIGDQWNSTAGETTYTFTVEDVSEGLIHLNANTEAR